nr:pirin-like C-terminal cupin domain-containing protein [uncultured Cupriavidus sp.]
MTTTLSPTAHATLVAEGAHFSVRRLDLPALGDFASPVMGFDHYRMTGPTFAPHPHAGFSAVSYVFEDSAGGLRNRDSLGHNLVIKPGEMVWTQAGRGIVHDEFPAQFGHEVHGVQVFVNLASSNKSLAPQMMHAAARDVPVVQDTSGNSTRVLSGEYCQARGPVVAKEPFDFLDVKIVSEWGYALRSNENVLIYVLSGAIDVVTSEALRPLQPYQAIAARGNADQLLLRATTPAHILVLSGTENREPVAVYGPFIMNTPDELAAAFERYRNGEMGRLLPVSRTL